MGTGTGVAGVRAAGIAVETGLAITGVGRGSDGMADDIDAGTDWVGADCEL